MFSINLGLPDHRNRVRVKSITYTKQGLTDDLKCPECEGEGVNFTDNTHAKGGDVIPQLCGYCDGKGNIDEDMVDINFDHEGEPVIIYKSKEGDESCQT